MSKDTFVIVSYDITEDKLRSWFADELTNLGLRREQYSLFKGTIPSKRVKSIEDAARKCRETEDCKIRIIPLCARCQKHSICFPEEEEKTNDYTII